MLNELFGWIPLLLILLGPFALAAFIFLKIVSKTQGGQRHQEEIQKEIVSCTIAAVMTIVALNSESLNLRLR